MFSNKETTDVALQAGATIRRLRIARGDTQVIFAQRIGVSVPTLRALEQGDPGVQLGNWLSALWVLNRLPRIADALKDEISLFDELERPPARQRARGKRGR